MFITLTKKKKKKKKNTVILPYDVTNYYVLKVDTKYKRSTMIVCLSLDVNVSKPSMFATNKRIRKK